MSGIGVAAPSTTSRPASAPPVTRTRRSPSRSAATPAGYDPRQRPSTNAETKRLAPAAESPASSLMKPVSAGSPWSTIEMPVWMSSAAASSCQAFGETRRGPTCVSATARPEASISDRASSRGFRPGRGLRPPCRGVVRGTLRRASQHRGGPVDDVHELPVRRREVEGDDRAEVDDEQRSHHAGVAQQQQDQPGRPGELECDEKRDVERPLPRASERGGLPLLPQQRGRAREMLLGGDSRFSRLRRSSSGASESRRQRRRCTCSGTGVPIFIGL